MEEDELEGVRLEAGSQVGSGRLKHVAVLEAAPAGSSRILSSEHANIVCISGSCEVG